MLTFDITTGAAKAQALFEEAEKKKLKNQENKEPNQKELNKSGLSLVGRKIKIKRLPAANPNNASTKLIP